MKAWPAAVKRKNNFVVKRASQCSGTRAERKCSTDSHGAELARTHRNSTGQRQHAIDFSSQLEVKICVCIQTHQKQLQLSRTVAVVANKTLYIHTKSACAC